MDFKKSRRPATAPSLRPRGNWYLSCLLAMADEPETLGNTSVFPPPPSAFRRFTAENAAWLALLQAHGGVACDADAVDERLAVQRTVLEAALRDTPVDKRAALILPEFDLERELLPPRIDWIEEDGGYMLYGQRWPIPDVSPSLDQLGIPRMFPDSAFDRTEVLQTILRTLLQTYFELTCDLLKPVQPYDVWVPHPLAGAPGEAPHTSPLDEAPGSLRNTTQPPAGHWTPSSHIRQRLRHMEVAIINFQYLLNELRPVQARISLEHLLEAQIERRTRATRLLRERCAAMCAELSTLSM